MIFLFCFFFYSRRVGKGNLKRPSKLGRKIPSRKCSESRHAWMRVKIPSWPACQSAGKDDFFRMLWRNWDFSEKKSSHRTRPFSNRFWWNFVSEVRFSRNFTKPDPQTKSPNEIISRKFVSRCKFSTVFFLTSPRFVTSELYHISKIIYISALLHASAVPGFLILSPGQPPRCAVRASIRHAVPSRDGRGLCLF